MSTREGTWHPFGGAHTAVLPMHRGEARLIIEGPAGDGSYRAVEAPHCIRIPGHMVRQAFGDGTVPAGSVMRIPLADGTLVYILARYFEGVRGRDWWQANRAAGETP
jgi:hypothetical protein